LGVAEWHHLVLVVEMFLLSLLARLYYRRPLQMDAILEAMADNLNDVYTMTLADSHTKCPNCQAHLPRDLGDNVVIVSEIQLNGGRKGEKSEGDGDNSKREEDSKKEENTDGESGKEEGGGDGDTEKEAKQENGDGGRRDSGGRGVGGGGGVFEDGGGEGGRGGGARVEGEGGERGEGGGGSGASADSTRRGRNHKEDGLDTAAKQRSALQTETDVFDSSCTTAVNGAYSSDVNTHSSNSVKHSTVVAINNSDDIHGKRSDCVDDDGNETSISPSLTKQRNTSDSSTDVDNGAIQTVREVEMQSLAKADDVIRDEDGGVINKALDISDVSENQIETGKDSDGIKTDHDGGSTRL
jgi:hypothetical protein